MCHWCSYHILTSSVIYNWIRCTATCNLFVVYNTEKAFLFQNIYFNITRKPAVLLRLCPTFVPKKLFDVIYDLYKMKQFHWSLCVAKNCQLVEKNRATVKPDSSVAPLWTETYSERRIELQNLQILKKMLEKIKSVFVIGAALWAEKLGRCLENYRSWKNTLRKLVVTVNLEAIWF